MFRIAAQDFNAANMALSPTTDNDDDNWVRVFSSLQTMLSSAAVLSKLLWVQQVKVDHQGVELSADKLRIRELGLARAKALRRALKVTQIPILQSQKMRNAFEHFDSRLDEFLDTPDRFLVVDFNVGDPDYVSRVLPDGNELPVKMLRHYHRVTNTASVLDEQINLQELADAVSTLDHESRVWLATKQEPLD